MVAVAAIRIRVLYFGQARDAAGTGAEELSVPASSSVGTLVELSTRAHVGLGALSGGMRFAVNEELATEDSRLADGDVVAFLPPVAGG
jgi:molybdopterin converting factor subunit 1